MSDRATISIDCERGSVSLAADLMQSLSVGCQAETTYSFLIAQLIMPQIKELMSLSKDELMKRHIDMLCK